MAEHNSSTPPIYLPSIPIRAPSLLSLARGGRTPALCLCPGLGAGAEQEFYNILVAVCESWSSPRLHFFPAVLLPFIAYACRCSLLRRAGRQRSTLPCSFGLCSALSGGSREGFCPFPPLQNKLRMGFIFLSTSGLSAQCDVRHTVSYLGLLVKEGCGAVQAEKLL